MKAVAHVHSLLFLKKEKSAKMWESQGEKNWAHLQLPQLNGIFRISKIFTISVITLVFMNPSILSLISILCYQVFLIKNIS